MWLNDFHARPVATQFSEVVSRYAFDFHPVVHFDPQTESIGSIDLSVNNPLFTQEIFSDTRLFLQFIDRLMQDNKFLIGGYLEERSMYKRSHLFDKNLRPSIAVNEEPRTIHLGMDIWGRQGSAVFAPLGGMIESFANNAHHGDYGPTIILQHQIETLNFYTLYGHLAAKNLENIRLGQVITRGEQFANFGSSTENGNWPPHLHFQLIFDMENFDGDYPGVCKKSEWQHYAANCPDPDKILQLKKFLKV